MKNCLHVQLLVVCYSDGVLLDKVNPSSGEI
jgi:hypothetical protein